MINKSITTNLDLLNLAKKFNIDLDAVIYKDKLLEYDPNKNASYILTLRDSTDNETGHWVALYIHNNKAIYFDSFGVIYPNVVREFCKNKELEYNSKELQNINSGFCGQYCLMFLNYLQHGYSLKDFTDMFE
jgi:hypothetical protein